MKWAKKLKTKNGQNMWSGPFSHDAAHIIIIIIIIIIITFLYSPQEKTHLYINREL